MYKEDEFKNVPVGTKLWCIPVGECVVVSSNWYILVSYDEKPPDRFFLPSGKFYLDDKYPTLFWSKPTDADPYPKRPKRKVRKEIKVYVDVYGKGETRVYTSLSGVLHTAKPEAIAKSVECVGHYEVEE